MCCDALPEQFSGGGNFGLGDINPTVFFTPNHPGKIIWGRSQPVNISLRAFGNVVKPTNGPDWQVRFQFTFLIP